MQEKKLNGFQLKSLALLLMLLDHIHYFFEFTGRVPLVFSWLGRLAGGLFLFTMIEGYSHTSNKKKYFSRIYIISILMNLFKYLLQFSPDLQRGDGFVPANGIMQSFTILMVIFYGLDLIREKNYLRGGFFMALPFLLQYAMALFINVFIGSMTLKNWFFVIFTSIFPSPFMAEGGIFVLLSGLVLYIFREHRKRQALAFFLFQFLFMTLVPLVAIKPLSLSLMFTDYYEWMGAFAALIFLLYNGERGRSMKKLFYIFYPAHIYILYFLSILVYKSL